MFVCSAFLLTRTSVKRLTIREILVTSAAIARFMSSGISLSRLSYDIKSFKLLGAKLSMRTHTLQSTSVTASVKKMLLFLLILSIVLSSCLVIFSLLMLLLIQYNRNEWFVMLEFRCLHWIDALWTECPTRKPSVFSLDILLIVYLFSVDNSTLTLLVIHCLNSTKNNV